MPGSRRRSTGPTDACRWDDSVWALREAVGGDGPERVLDGPEVNAVRHLEVAEPSRAVMPVERHRAQRLNCEELILVDDDAVDGLAAQTKRGRSGDAG